MSCINRVWSGQAALWKKHWIYLKNRLFSKRTVLSFWVACDLWWRWLGPYAFLYGSIFRSTNRITSLQLYSAPLGLEVWKVTGQLISILYSGLQWWWHHLFFLFLPVVLAVLAFLAFGIAAGSTALALFLWKKSFFLQILSPIAVWLGLIISPLFVISMVSEILGSFPVRIFMQSLIAYPQTMIKSQKGKSGYTIYMTGREWLQCIFHHHRPKIQLAP